VPIQKNTEREIFDYIDLQSMEQLLSDRWFNESKENEVNGDETITETTQDLWIDWDEYYNEDINEEYYNEEISEDMESENSDI
jgi:hypothetical protein